MQGWKSQLSGRTPQGGQREERARHLIQPDIEHGLFMDHASL